MSIDNGHEDWVSVRKLTTDLAKRQASITASNIVLLKNFHACIEIFMHNMSNKQSSTSKKLLT
jgi:hypothetical protein